MKPEQWNRVEELFHEALERAPAEREAFLTAACGGDEALRREVESLLAHEREAERLMEEPAVGAATPKLAVVRGTRLGPYEVTDLLGAGGMGEVYRARDTRLGRDVAIKVLPERVAHDPDALARFGREARAVAALSHPHIAALFDIGEKDGTHYLVMELLEGETLAARLRRGALPEKESLRIGAEIAEALGAAHAHGIVHRDVKPANVMLTRSGVKLLDFGLARLQRKAGSPGETATATTELGERGIAGTLPYMAPEQLEGREADARTDIWALGCVLFEMLAGRRAFEGDSQAGLIAAIEKDDVPSVALHRPAASPALERLVKRCLAKATDDRWDSARDLADELRWIGQAQLASAETATERAGGRWRWGLVVGGLALAASATVGGLAGRRFLAPAGAPPFVVRSLLDVRPAEELNAGGLGATWLPTPGGSRTALAWTPDGRSLVFVGRRGGVQRLYVRALDEEEARPLEGSEGAQVPAVSPDGRWVGFWASRAIRRVPLAGGPAAVLVEGVTLTPAAMTWGEDGRLFYDYGSPDLVIQSVEPERTPTALTRRLEGETAHALPHLLPGGRALLYTVQHREWTWGDEDVVAHVFATGERKLLVRDATDARYVASGHLVFLRRGVLQAVAFDLERLVVRGTPVPVLDSVAQALLGHHGADVTGAGQFTVAPTGALAYVRGAVVPFPDAQLVAVDRQGRVSPIHAPGRSYGNSLGLSPDGRRLAVPIRSLTERALWLYDLERGTLGKLTGAGEVGSPRWTPDGQSVVFSRLREGVYELAWQRADGTGDPEVLARDATPFLPSSWSPDGRHLALLKHDGDIWIATLGKGKAEVEPLARTPDIEQWPEFSPDGRWLAYGSNSSGRNEVYVQPYPGPGPREQVSLEGGESPAWSPTRRELFFLSLPDSEGMRRMMLADVRPGPALTFGKPRRPFDFSPLALGFRCFPCRCFAVAADGERFYVQQQPPAPPPAPVTHVHLVLNWFAELERLCPTRR